MAGEPKATLEPSEADLLATRNAMLPELLRILKESKVPHPDRTLEALVCSGLDALLFRSILLGRVAHDAARKELDRLRKALADRTLPANEIKLGIVAFDDLARRLAISAGRGGMFRYPNTQNRARDSLLAFARSLHR